MPTDRAFLNKLQIASPCPAAWAEMNGDERARFCATCEKHVYDFSKMTAAEGVALIRQKEGQVCVRLWKRADGTVITADCPVGVKRLVRRSRGRFPLLAASLFAVAGLGIGCGLRKPVPVSAPESKSALQERSACDLKQKDKKVQVVVGFASAASGLDPTSTATGMTIDSEAMEHLPLR
jgi:hypothetical protein